MVKSDNGSTSIKGTPLHIGMDLLAIMQTINEMKENDYLEYMAIILGIQFALKDKDNSEYFVKILLDFATNLQDITKDL